MAARTFTSAGVNNLWSNVANWDGGVAIPQEDDSVTIPAGQTCEYDYNSAYTTGIAGITVTGTLKLTRTAGTYKLFMKASATIGGAGTFDCGTSGDVIPFAAKHTITGGSGWYINGGSGLTMTVYAAEPTIKYVRLTATEPIGETVIAVDTDVTGDIWAAGDSVHIVRPLKNANVCEQRVIAAAGIASGTITITAGLTAEKYANNWLVLMTRNVKFIVNGTEAIKGFSEGKITIAGGMFDALTSNYAIATCPGITISGGSFLVGITSSSITYISGGVFVRATTGTIINCTAHISDILHLNGQCGLFNYSKISGGIFSGGVYFCNEVNFVVVTGGDFSHYINIFSKAAHANIIGGNYTDCTYVTNNSSALLNNCTMSNNSLGDCSLTMFSAYNVLFGSTVEVVAYTSLPEIYYSQSINHDQVAGAYKAWTSGGITTKQAVTVPVGYLSAMQTVLVNGTVKGYWQKEVTVSAGASINIEMQLRKDASMTYLPRCIVFSKADTDPFAGGAGLKTFTMTDSIDTWESDVYTYTNTGTEDVTLVIRCQGMNATGNLYSLADVEQINVDLTGAIALLNAIKPKTDLIPASPAPANEYDARLVTIQADLDNPSQYKADVSGLATASEYDADFTQVVELLYSIMGGEGWTDETLVSIQAAIEAISGIDEAGVRNAIGLAAANLDTQLTNIPKGTTVYDGKTLTELIKLISAVLLGKLSGGGTGQLAFRDIADTKDRVIADIDLATGDRTTQTLDGA